MQLAELEIRLGLESAEATRLIVSKKAMITCDFVDGDYRILEIDVQKEGKDA